MTVKIDGYGNLTASKALLNYLSLVLQDHADYEREQGKIATAEKSESMSDKIYEELKATGYYN